MFLLLIFLAEIDYLERAAAELDIPFTEVRMDEQDLNFYGYGKYRLKIFDNLVYRPEKVASYFRAFSHSILKYSDSLWALCYFPWARIDEGVRRGLIQRPEKALLDSINKISDKKKYLETLLKQNFGAEFVELDNLQDSLILGLTLILAQITKSYVAIDTATQSVTTDDIDEMLKMLLEEQEDGLVNRYIEKLIESTDFKILAADAMDLGYVLQLAIEIMKVKTIDKSYEIVTDFGKIEIGGINNDSYTQPPYLLIIDFGGDDNYQSCGVSTKEHPVSLIIDYQGNDIYEGNIGPGTAVCGYAFVVDAAGDDIYSSQKIGLATGIFGQGIILDLAGNDTYSTDIYGEGAGLFGVGVLSDLKGNDTYQCFQCSQGFGFVKGAGILIDREGDDTYVARDDTIKYPSSQSKEHNTSLSQGVGFGIRADYTDGHSLAGGCGMLIDASGNDKYSCGVFGQGCAYWFGVGLLVDYKGNDTYDGVWYVQGAGAHFGLAVLIDSSGNDKYSASMNMAQGAGHDFTLGILVDYEGDDYHNAPNLSLGGGNANGMGIFIDYLGDDKYVTHGGITLGRASIASRGSLRDHMKCLGIFVDGQGKDEYTEPFAKNKKAWKQVPPLKPSLPTEKCLGMDY